MTKDAKLSIVIGLAGIAAAWYWSKKNAAQLAAVVAGAAQQPTSVLPSRLLNPAGYITAITGGNGMAPLQIDAQTGDVSAPFGTDLLLPAIDSNDPTLFDGLADDPQTNLQRLGLSSDDVNVDTTISDQPDVFISGIQ